MSRSAGNLISLDRLFRSLSAFAIICVMFPEMFEEDSSWCNYWFISLFFYCCSSNFNMIYRRRFRFFFRMVKPSVPIIPRFFVAYEISAFANGRQWI